MTPQEQVLQAAISRLGRREISQNRGPIVEECCRPFVDPETFDRLYAKNMMFWCAGFVSLCWTEVWPGFADIASVDCDVLWKRCAARGWTRLRGEGPPPGPADLVFFRNLAKEDLDLDHVGLVEGGSIRTIEGNSQAFKGDTGSVRRRRHAPDRPSIYGFATPIPR